VAKQSWWINTNDMWIQAEFSELSITAIQPPSLLKQPYMQPHCPMFPASQQHSPMFPASQPHSPMFPASQPHSPMFPASQPHSPMFPASQPHSPMFPVSQPHSPMFPASQPHSPIFPASQPHSPLPEDCQGLCWGTLKRSWAAQLIGRGVNHAALAFKYWKLQERPPMALPLQ
jgi:hypothetical protein